MKPDTIHLWPKREGAERERKSAEQPSWLRGCSGTCWSKQKWQTQVQQQRGGPSSLERGLLGHGQLSFLQYPGVKGPESVHTESAGLSLWLEVLSKMGPKKLGHKDERCEAW